MDRCRYPSKPCLNARAVKLNGELHRFCEQHRRQANQNQMRWSKRKQTVLRVRRGDGEDGDDDDHRPPSVDGNEPHATNDVPRGYAPPHGMHLPPPPMPHGMNMQVHAAGTSLSHLSLHNGHNHGMPPPNGGLISSFQDHVARGGAIPGTNGVNLVLSGGAVRRELAPAPPPMPSHLGHVPPPSALPPLLPPRGTAEPPDPAVAALLMIASDRTTSSTSSQSIKQETTPNEDDDEDAQVRRELKRAKSNEWIARPTHSSTNLPTVASLVTNGVSTTTSSMSSTSSGLSVASIGRSASWQPPVRVDPERESLNQWMQRKQASLPSISNITGTSKRSYDSMSSSAPSSSASNSFLHRGPENSNLNYSSSGPSLRGSYHVPLHPVSSSKSKVSTTSSSSDPANDGTKRSALV